MEKSSGNAPALGTDIRPEDEQLGLTANTLYGLQHVLTMYGGIVAVPLVMANADGMSAADTGLLITACLFMGGLATLLQTLGIPFFGSRLPLVQGVSFSGVATMVSILHTGGGMQGVLGAVLFASVFGLIIAPIFSKLTRFFPPLVNGCVITIIGLSLMPVAAHWAMGGNPQAADYGSMGNIGLAGLSLVIVLALSKLGNAMISRLSILLAIVIGTAVAAMIGKSDFSEVGSGAWFAVPMPLHFGWPTFSLAATLSMSIVILVTLVETSADILAVGDIVGTRVDSRRLADGLRADMLSSVVAPFFGSFTQSAFAQNVGLVAVTGIKSRYVVAFSGLILIAFGPAAHHGAHRGLRAALGAGRRGPGAFWHGGGQRHPHAGQGGLSQQHEPDHRGGVHRHGRAAHGQAGLLSPLPGLVRHHVPFGHQLHGGDRAAAEPGLQPLQAGQPRGAFGVRRRF